MLDRIQVLLNNEQDASPRETLQAINSVFIDVYARLNTLEAPATAAKVATTETIAPATAAA